MLLSLLVYGLLAPAAAPAPPEGERCWSGSSWEWCTQPPPDAVDVPPPATMTDAPATTPAQPAPPSTFTVVPLGGTGGAPAVLVAVRDRLAAAWRGGDPVIEVSAVAGSSCVDVVCGRRENAVDVVIAADVRATPDGAVVTVFVDDGVHSVSAVREVDVSADVVAAAVEALAEARAKLSPTPPAAAPPPPEATMTPEATTTPKTTMTEASASPDDLLMLGVAYLMMLVPSGSLFLPVWQGVAFAYGGPGLVNYDYPNAWNATLICIGLEVGGIAASLGTIVGGFFVASGVQDANILYASVGVAMVLLVVTQVSEPAAFYFIARDGAVALQDPEKTARPPPPNPTTTP